MLLNHIYKKSEHIEFLAEAFYNRRYSADRIKSMVQTWDPSISKFETYFYGIFKKSILEFLKRADREPDMEPDELEEENQKQYAVEDIIDIEMCWSILNGLLFLTNIRPHKKLFFISTNAFYLVGRNIEARAFYMDNHEKKLGELYRGIHDNTRFWEIRELLEEFHSGDLSLPASSVYLSKAGEDKMIMKLADGEVVINTQVDIYFNDCYMKGKIDLVCTGQRLASWNYHIRRAVREILRKS